MKEKIIYTIGHSTRSIEEFIEILKSFNIELLADIRNFPGSKRFPHFNKDALEFTLQKNNIQYIHIKELGGRRKPVSDSSNAAWKVEAFRGYADYMETENFKIAVKELEKLAIQNHTVYMCSEAVWWRCHRALLSDYLKSTGWKVIHIMGINKGHEHPYTAPARVENGELTYRQDQLF
jgi:uncharacterized protein (DUF488 family)